MGKLTPEEYKKLTSAFMRPNLIEAATTIEEIRAEKGMFRTTVQYQRTLEGYILARGAHYFAHVEQCIERSMTAAAIGIGPIKLGLLCFGRPVTTRTVTDTFARAGVRPPRLEEFLSACIDEHKPLQGMPTVALGRGVCIKGIRRYPRFNDCYEGERMLTLESVHRHQNRRWPECYRFLFVPHLKLT